MEQDYEREIEEIIDVMKCPKDFKCYKSGFEYLCKAEDIGLKSFLVCLEENPEGCKFSMRFGYSRFFCQCPLRLYIAKKLKR